MFNLEKGCFGLKKYLNNQGYILLESLMAFTLLVSMLVIWHMSIQQMSRVEKDRREELESFHLLDNAVVTNVYYQQTKTGYVTNQRFEKRVIHNGKETTIRQLSR